MNMQMSLVSQGLEQVFLLSPHKAPTMLTPRLRTSRVMPGRQGLRWLSWLSLRWVVAFPAKKLTFDHTAYSSFSYSDAWFICLLSGIFGPETCNL